MTVPNPTFNLTALGDRLFAEKRLLPLADNIRRARDLRSLSVDLEMALESLDALDALLEAPTASENFLQQTTKSALLNNALVLYVRATKTSSKQRGGFDLCSRFSEVEKVTHKELADLRDFAIAHFGSGGSYGGVWQAELVILQFEGEVAKPAVTTRRKMVDPKLVKQARKQIEVALALLHVLTLEKLEEVTDEINKAFAENPAFYTKEVSQHPLNLDIFSTSDEAGMALRSSFEKGYVKGILTQG